LSGLPTWQKGTSGGLLLCGGLGRRSFLATANFLGPHPDEKHIKNLAFTTPLGADLGCGLMRTQTAKKETK